MKNPHCAAVLLAVAFIVVASSIGCNPKATPTAGDASSTSEHSSTSPSRSGQDCPATDSPTFEPPVTVIDYYDLEARTRELFEYQQQHQYGTRVKEEPLSESDPRHQTVAGALDAIYRQNNMDAALKYFPRNICVGVLDLAKDFRYRAGSFEELLSCRLVDVLVQPSDAERSAGVETKTVQYVEARCRWSGAVMLCRMSFVDDPGEKKPPLETFWLARDPEGPTPSGFASGGYLKGGGKLALAHRDEKTRSETISQMSTSLPSMQIELVSTTGDLGPEAIGLTLWKIFPALDPLKYPKTGAGQGSSISYFWDEDGNFWRPFASIAKSARMREGGAEPQPNVSMEIKTPEEGTYRLSSLDRMAMGSPFTLDRAKPIAKATLVLDQDWRGVPCEIEAVLVDSETGERIQGPDDMGFSYKIYRDGYLPITSKRMDFLGANRLAFDGESRSRYSVDLRPGTYQVDVHCGYGRLSENAFGQVSYFRTSLIPVSITVDPVRETPSFEEGSRERRHIPLPVPMQTLSPTSQAAEELLPFSLQGTVAHEDGSPVPNIPVTARQVNEEIARTTTDENGRYQLRFAVPELIDLDPVLIASNDFIDTVNNLQKQGLPFGEASAVASEKSRKAHVTVLAEHPTRVVRRQGLLVATKSVPDAERTGSVTDAPASESQVLNKHFIAPGHPVTDCNLVLATVAQLEAEFVDAEGNRIVGGNLGIMDPLFRSRRLTETRDATGLHHVKDVVTSNPWMVSTIAIDGPIDYLEQPVIQLPEPGLWKITFQVVPSPIINPANDELWEATKAERVGNRGKPADGPVSQVIVRSALDKPMYRHELTTLKILKVTKPDGSNVDPSFILRR